MTERPSDRNVEAICDRLAERSARGIAKYGTTTERGDVSFVEWLRHLQEELLDGAVYIEAAIARTLDATPAEPGASDGTTHADGCHTWGTRHYECAIRELARLRAEVAENKREIDELVRAVNLGSERAKKAERERDELRRRIAEAPKARPLKLQCIGYDDPDRDRLTELVKSGARCAMVVLDAEEGK